MFPSPTTHPGTVTFVGFDGTEKIGTVDELPEWLRFGAGPDGRPVPVVRVARWPNEQGFTLRGYAASGRLLWVTLMVPPAPTFESEPVLATPRSQEPRRAACQAAPEPTGWF
jgi:hypothetical protein